MTETAVLQKRLAAIDIFEETIVATTFADGKPPCRKIIEPADAVEIFLKTDIRDRTGENKIQWLQFGPRVVRIGLQNNGDLIIWVTRAAKKTTLKMQVGSQGKIQRLQVSMPNLLAELVRRSGRWADVRRVFAYWGPLTSKTVLYMPPLPNVHRGGGVCMGSVDTNAAAKPGAADYLEDALFGTLFSDHLLQNPLKNTKRWRNIWQALKQTRGKGLRPHLNTEGTYGRLK